MLASLAHWIGGDIPTVSELFSSSGLLLEREELLDHYLDVHIPLKKFIRFIHEYSFIPMMRCPLCPLAPVFSF